MRKGQVLTIAIFAALLAILYFGCDTKTKQHKEVEKSRSENFELINIKKIIAENRSAISAKGQAELHDIEQKLGSVEEESQALDLQKSLASLWYAEGHPIISGHYAEEIARSTNSEDAWSIMGTTFSLAAQKETDDTKKNFAIGKAREAYEKAIDIDTTNVDHKINLALSYVDVMDMENPMKGILMLRQLSTDFPENPSVLFQLGRLSLGTNQLEKAVERLTRAIELKPDLRSAHCLLAETYVKMGNNAKAAVAQINCDK